MDIHKIVLFTGLHTRSQRIRWLDACTATSFGNNSLRAGKIREH